MARGTIGVVYGAPQIEMRDERLSGRTTEGVIEGLYTKLKSLGRDVEASKTQVKLAGTIVQYGARNEFLVTKLIKKYNFITICQLVAKIRDSIIRAQISIWLAGHMNLKPQSIIDIGRWRGGENAPRIVEFRMGGSCMVKARNKKMLMLVAESARATNFSLN